MRSPLWPCEVGFSKVGLDEQRGLYVVVGLGGGGATESAKSRLLKRDARTKARETKLQAKQEAREKRQEARRVRNLAAGLEEDEVADESDSDDVSSSDSESDEEDEDEEGDEARSGKNRFGTAFQEVVKETNARVRMDSFEACVIEIRKGDLSGFLESLSRRVVVG